MRGEFIAGGTDMMQLLQEGVRAAPSGLVELNRLLLADIELGPTVAPKTDDGKVRQAQIAVGGVVTKPWRLRQVEQALTGRQIMPRSFGLSGSRGAGRRRLSRADLSRHDCHSVSRNDAMAVDWRSSALLGIGSAWRTRKGSN
jgi:hypothetical protein